MKIKVNIIYGSTKYFNGLLPDENVINFSEFVRWIDARRTNIAEDQLIGTYQYLTATAEEYGSVTESFIESFILVLLNYQNQLKYQEVYLHNPPTRIFNQIEIYNKYFHVFINKEKYPKVTIDTLRLIKEGFDKRILGQNHVKNKILQTIYELSKTDVRKPKVIMLYGPPGVGKTETASFLNDCINQNDNSKLLRKQFSMFHNESFYSYIFGDMSSSFSKDLLGRESNLILLDEFDKCNPAFFSAFYQLFDEGIYEDKFYKVNLLNTIVLCTSNYLSEQDIKNALGAAIFSRFDAFIKYEALSQEAKELLIEQIYEEEISKYSEGDVAIVENYKVDIKEALKQNGQLINNVREIRMYIKQMISVPLIQNI